MDAKDHGQAYEISPSEGNSSQASEEERVYSLLFGECDKDNTGLVDINSLVKYIRRMRLQVPCPEVEEEEGEEALDTCVMEDFDLKLLRDMLEPNCDQENRIDQVTYTTIIRKWVSAIRERSPHLSYYMSPRGSTQYASCPGQSPSQVSQIIGSPEQNPEEPNHSYGSYVDRNLSNSSLDPQREQELNDLVAKYQHEIRQLKTLNQQLLIQHEHSEDNLKDYQGRTDKLQQKLEDAQASLGKLNELRATNTELNRRVGDTKKDNSELVWAKERLNREMEKLREELGDVQTHLNSAESEREVALEEVKSLQHLLFQNKEADNEAVFKYEQELQESKSSLEVMNRDLETAQNTNADLTTTVQELESQLLRLRAVKQQPFSSTPFHQTAPSLHEEMLSQVEGSTLPPLNLDYSESTPEGLSRSFRREVHLTPAMESFTKLLDDTDSKIEFKTRQIYQELGELMNQQSPGTSRRETTSIISQEDTSLNQVEAKLKLLMRRKNQFKNDNMNLKQENTDLRDQLKLLEENMLQHQSKSRRTSHGTSPFMDALQSRRTSYGTAPMPDEEDSSHYQSRRTSYGTVPEPSHQQQQTRRSSRSVSPNDPVYQQTRRTSRNVSPNDPVYQQTRRTSRSVSPNDPVYQQSRRTTSRSVSPAPLNDPSRRTSYDTSPAVRDDSTHYQPSKTSFVTGPPSTTAGRQQRSRKTSRSISPVPPPNDPSRRTSYGTSPVIPDDSTHHHQSRRTSFGTGRSTSPFPLSSRSPSPRTRKDGSRSPTPIGREEAASHYSHHPPRETATQYSDQAREMATQYSHGHGGDGVVSRAVSAMTPLSGRRSPTDKLTIEQLSGGAFTSPEESFTTFPSTTVVNTRPLPRSHSPRHESTPTYSEVYPSSGSRHSPSSPSSPHGGDGGEFTLPPPSSHGGELPTHTSAHSSVHEASVAPTSPHDQFLHSSRSQARRSSSPPTFATHLPLPQIKHPSGKLEDPNLEAALIRNATDESGLTGPQGPDGVAYTETDEDLLNALHKVITPTGSESSLVQGGGEKQPKPILRIVAGSGERGKKVHYDGDTADVAVQYDSAESCSSSVYQAMKLVVLVMFLSLVILAFIVLLLLSRDAVENCGSHCPQSPIHILYSSLEPFIHFSPSKGYF